MMRDASINNVTLYLKLFCALDSLSSRFVYYQNAFKSAQERREISFQRSLWRWHLDDLAECILREQAIGDEHQRIPDV